MTAQLQKTPFSGVEIHTAQLDSVKLDLIPFPGGQLLATLIGDQGSVFLKPLVEGLGVGYANQLKKLKTKSWSKTRMVLVTTQLPGDTQARQHVVVPAKVALMLLATIDENKVAEHARPALIKLQDEIADIVEKFYTEGAAISDAITTTQMDRVEEKFVALRAARMLEALDYRSVIHLIATKDAEGTDYGTIQNNFYLHLFGVTARAIVKTRPQLQGERRKTGDKGFTAQSGRIAKNYLTEQELTLLAEAVGMFQKVAEYASFSRELTLDDIKRLSVEVAQKIAAKYRTVHALAA